MIPNPATEAIGLTNGVCLNVHHPDELDGGTVLPVAVLFEDELEEEGQGPPWARGIYRLEFAGEREPMNHIHSGKYSIRPQLLQSTKFPCATSL